MKQALQIFYLSILISNFSYSQNLKIEKNTIKYFDENYKPISNTEFQIKKWKNSFLSIQGDSINHKILSIRETHGTIGNKKALDSLLTSATNKKIDSSKPIVIIYYPGKDPCNSSGSATRKRIRNWYNKMEKGINKIKESTIIYIYKGTDGLYGKNDGFKNWVKDPENNIERLFFNRHYPCSSFVIISEKSEFISFFGEFSKEKIWETTKMLSN
ncbi:MAG: hypothetical protein COA88_09345 [Kordia sp.]|nr:MAG: hypothetical protein COA88_09345 [Kordia sp.]